MIRGIFQRVAAAAALVVLLAVMLAVTAGPTAGGDRHHERDGRDDGPRRSCAHGLVGAHLLTVRNLDGDITSRAVLAFHDDGSFVGLDSTQGRGVEGAAFSAQLGTYECTGRRTASALLLDFGFLDPPDIGRTDWTITIDRRTKSIRGSVVLYIILDGPDADPLAPGHPPFGTFTFEGVRVPAQVR